MAHVGEEFALGPTGGLGASPRLIELGQGFLDALAGRHPLGDVLDHAQVPGTLAGFPGHRGDGHADPDQGAVRMEIALVHLEARDLPGVEARHLRQAFLHVVRMGDRHPVNGGHFLAAPADDGGEAVVDLDDVTAQRVDQGDAQGGLLEHDAQARLGAGHARQGLGQLGLAALARPQLLQVQPDAEGE